MFHSPLGIYKKVGQDALVNVLPNRNSQMLWVMFSLEYSFNEFSIEANIIYGEFIK